MMLNTGDAVDTFFVALATLLSSGDDVDYTSILIVIGFVVIACIVVFCALLIAKLSNIEKYLDRLAEQLVPSASDADAKTDDKTREEIASAPVAVVVEQKAPKVVMTRSEALHKAGKILMKNGSVSSQYIADLTGTDVQWATGVRKGFKKICSVLNKEPEAADQDVAQKTGLAVQDVSAMRKGMGI